MSTRIPGPIRDTLKILESELQNAIYRGSPEEAIDIAIRIQFLFEEDRTHFRLLRAKLWALRLALMIIDYPMLSQG